LFANDRLVFETLGCSDEQVVPLVLRVSPA